MPTNTAAPRMNYITLKLTPDELRDLQRALTIAAHHLKHGYSTGGIVTNDAANRAEHYTELADRIGDIIESALENQR